MDKLGLDFRLANFRFQSAVFQLQYIERKTIKKISTHMLIQVPIQWFLYGKYDFFENRFTHNKWKWFSIRTACVCLIVIGTNSPACVRIMHQPSRIWYLSQMSSDHYDAQIGHYCSIAGENWSVKSIMHFHEKSGFSYPLLDVYDTLEFPVISTLDTTTKQTLSSSYFEKKYFLGWRKAWLSL